MTDSAPKPIRIYRDCLNEIRFSLNEDFSADEFRSQIRAGRDPDSALIADLIPSFVTDGSDGELLFTLDEELSGAITQHSGYMDVIRKTEGHDVPLLDVPLRVEIRDTVTS